MKKNSLILIWLVTFILFFTFSDVQATTEGENFFNNVFSQADAWKDKGSAGSGKVGTMLSKLIDTGGAVPIISILFTIGNLVIFVVTIALGLKYIYSGIEGKADIKGALPNYVLGVVFFYLAQMINDLSRAFMTGALDTGASYTIFTGNIYSTVNTIANICAILGIVLVGLKYMLSPADTKADVKKQLVPVTLGIVLVYCTLKVITLVYNIGQGILS